MSVVGRELRLLRALFNFAMGQYEDTKGHSLVTDNPVKRLSQSRAWFRVERRQGYIKANELKPWYEIRFVSSNGDCRWWQ